MCNMHSTFKSQVVAFIRHCMDEVLHTQYALECNKHEYSTYVTFMVTSNTHYYIALHVLHRAMCQT